MKLKCSLWRKLVDRERRNPKTCRLETKDGHYQLALGSQPLLEWINDRSKSLAPHSTRRAVVCLSLEILCELSWSCARSPTHSLQSFDCSHEIDLRCQPSRSWNVSTFNSLLKWRGKSNSPGTSSLIYVTVHETPHHDTSQGIDYSLETLDAI